MMAGTRGGTKLPPGEKNCSKEKGKEGLDSTVLSKGSLPVTEGPLTSPELHSACTDVTVRATLSTLGPFEHDPNYRNT